MQNFKEKLFNYETPPPEEIWHHIAGEINNENVVKMRGHKKNKFVFYTVAAAASVVIIFLGSVFLKKNSTPKYSYQNKLDQQNLLLAQETKDSVQLNQLILESIINNPKEKKEIVSQEPDDNIKSKTYLTVADPEGQPVKISPKVATLIISADNGYPPKPIWCKEIRRWQNIMLNSTISPTSANFADLVQLAANKQIMNKD
ncbi:MAG TPA: hypothetical protein VIJ75_06275 [Hanamia sp.]